MATLEDIISGLSKEFEGLKSKNEWMEMSLIHCQEEIIALKKYKLELEKDLDNRTKEVKDLKDLIGANREYVRRPGEDTVGGDEDDGVGDDDDNGDVAAAAENDDDDDDDNGGHAGDDDDDDDDDDEGDDNYGYTAADDDDDDIATGPSGATAFGQRIQNMSEFRVARRDSPIRVPRNRPVKIQDYDYDLLESRFMDKKTGVYGIPVRGRYGFEIGHREIDGRVDWFVCVLKRVKVAGKRMEEGGWYEYDRVEYECEKGEKVWVEGVGVGGRARVAEFAYYGQLRSTLR